MSLFTEEHHMFRKTLREFVERGRHSEDPFGLCNEAVGSVTPAAVVTVNGMTWPGR